MADQCVLAYQTLMQRLHLVETSIVGVLAMQRARGTRARPLLRRHLRRLKQQHRRLLYELKHCF